MENHMFVLVTKFVKEGIMLTPDQRHCRKYSKASGISFIGTKTELQVFKIKSNKRPMGHMAHLINQFKSINTFAQSYDHIITLIWRRKMVFYFLISEWSLFVKP